MYEHSLEIASILRKHSQGSSPRTKPRSLGKNGAGRQLSHKGHNEVRVEGLALTLVTTTSVVFSRMSFTEPSSKGNHRLESGHARGSGSTLTALWTPHGRGSSEEFRVLTSPWRKHSGPHAGLVSCQCSRIPGGSGVSVGFLISRERKEMHVWSRSLESLTVCNDVLFLSPIFIR